MEQEYHKSVGMAELALPTQEMISEQIFSDIIPVHEPFSRHPLVRQINGILEYVEAYKERVRKFYFRVLLSQYACPACGEAINMTGQSECSCRYGHTFDPTITFQTSPCCQAHLVRKTFHYSCSHCHKTVPSRFIFDEKIFDAEYFREMMQESRQRARDKREAVRRLLSESRSGSLFLTEDLQLDTLPNFIQDLDEFILGNPVQVCMDSFDLKSDFNPAAYRTHILELLGHHTLYFSSISPLMGDCRLDRVRRFITLIFMDNDCEISLQQLGNDLLIRRRNDETYAEG